MESHREVRKGERGKGGERRRRERGGVREGEREDG